jgi:phospholipase C
VLIITWDEHGGFFDHAIPPDAVPPGDTPVGSRYNEFGFTFERYGPRVPALVISPRIAKNVVDHRLYDHSSIPATIESLFGLSPMTRRDAAANRLDALVTLGAAREDTPERLPEPANSGAVAPALAAPAAKVGAAGVTRASGDVDGGNLPALLHAAFQQDLQAQGNAPGVRQGLVQRLASIQTRADAMAYMAEVQHRVQPLRQAAGAGQ